MQWGCRGGVWQRSSERNLFLIRFFLFHSTYFPFVTILTLFCNSVVIKLLRDNPLLCEKTALTQIASTVLYRVSRKKLMFYMLPVVTAAAVTCWLMYFIAQVVHGPTPCSLSFWRLLLAHVKSAIIYFHMLFSTRNFGMVIGLV